MVRCLNKVMVIGAIGRAPEMRYMPTGRPVTSFSVGATRSAKGREGDEHEEIEWFNVVAWGDLAEKCRSDLRKEDYVYIEGRLQTRRWETDHEGSRIRAELVASEMILLSRPDQNDFALAEGADDTT